MHPEQAKVRVSVRTLAVQWAEKPAPYGTDNSQQMSCALKSVGFMRTFPAEPIVPNYLLSPQCGKLSIKVPRTGGAGVLEAGTA